MKIIKLTKDNLFQSVKTTIRALSNGMLVIAPSDTVYGALVDATNEKAVNKLINFKSRPKGKPISVFVGNLKEAERYVKINKNQKEILTNLLPGPYTIVLPSKHKTSQLLESERQTLGIRIVNYPYINELTHLYKNPITATSANVSGKSSHYSIMSFIHSLPKYKKQLVDLIIDAGNLPRNKPSTVLDYSAEKIKILRKGSGKMNVMNTFLSSSPDETERIAQRIWRLVSTNNNDKPLVLLLQGELGAGKTVFIKGIGKILGIHDITSPTYTVSEEYKINKNGINKLIHIDLYNLFEKEEYKFIGLEENLIKGNMICIEWGEKTGDIFTLLKEKAMVVLVEIKYLTEKKRVIRVINYSS